MKKKTTGLEGEDGDEEEEAKAKLKRDQLLDKLATLNNAEKDAKQAKEEALLRQR